MRNCANIFSILLFSRASFPRVFLSRSRFIFFPASTPHKKHLHSVFHAFLVLPSVLYPVAGRNLFVVFHADGSLSGKDALEGTTTHFFLTSLSLCCRLDAVPANVNLFSSTAFCSTSGFGFAYEFVCSGAPWKNSAFDCSGSEGEVNMRISSDVPIMVRRGVLVSRMCERADKLHVHLYFFMLHPFTHTPLCSQQVPRSSPQVPLQYAHHTLPLAVGQPLVVEQDFTDPNPASLLKNYPGEVRTCSSYTSFVLTHARLHDLTPSTPLKHTQVLTGELVFAKDAMVGGGVAGVYTSFCCGELSTHEPQVCVRNGWKRREGREHPPSSRISHLVLSLCPFSSSWQFDVRGKIAVCERGICEYSTKVLICNSPFYLLSYTLYPLFVPPNYLSHSCFLSASRLPSVQVRVAQAFGAKGVIVVAANETPIRMVGSSVADLTIPAVSVIRSFGGTEVLCW